MPIVVSRSVDRDQESGGVWWGSGGGLEGSGGGLEGSGGVWRGSGIGLDTGMWRPQIFWRRIEFSQR
eukprot:1178007-Prorocentrum_minimum.AAC.2